MMTRPVDTTASINRRRFLGAGAVLVLASLLPSALRAETPIVSAPDAAARNTAQTLIILDIRSREEWAETGVAQGAWPVSMHEADFSQRLQAILNSYPPDRIALICATGGRSAYITKILEKNGIAGVADLSEGMLGNRRGPGWIKRGLPVVEVDAALADYASALQAQPDG